MIKATDMIQSHLYASKPETPLYAERIETSEKVCILNQGNWLGVFEEQDGWFRVLTIHGEGWVKAEDSEERSPFNLHVQWSPGEPIKYVSTAA